MEVTEHVELGPWLIPRVSAARAATPAGIVGAGFEAYLRILHPVSVSRDAPSRLSHTDAEGAPDESCWPWAEIARRNGRSMHPLVQWRQLSNEEDQGALSFPDGWSVERPPDYFLGAALLSRLVAHIHRSSRSAEDVVAAVWNGFGALNHRESLSADSAGWNELGVDVRCLSADDGVVHLVSRQVAEAVTSGPFFELPGREYLLFCSSLAELSDPRWVYSAGIGWGPGFPGVFPQLFWPATHEWVIGGDVDLDFTIVGGSSQLIHSIRSDARFESYIVEARDDLSRWGDVVNGQADSEEGSMHL